MATNDRFAFVAEYFDEQADLVRRYQLLYYADNTIEMHDLKNRKLFLKRCEYPSVRLNDLFVGAVVNIYSRQLKIVDYADEATARKFKSQTEKTLALIKPDAFRNMGKIIDAIQKDGFKIANIKVFKLKKVEAEEFYEIHKGKPFYNDLVAFMSSDYIVAMELVAPDAIQKWRRLIGPTNTAVAREQAPTTLRARFGTDNTRNACHGSDSPENAQKEIDFFFGKTHHFDNTAIFNNCTLCIIKPHAIAQGNAGKIIDAIIDEGFEVSALEMFTLDKANATDFLEVYKGVIPEYQSIVEELSTGSCIAIEVRQGEDTVNAFRQLCGPSDPAIAKILRPKSLRGKFGVDKVKNAVHCTDLAEDGVLEVEFFFNILQRTK